MRVYCSCLLCIRVIQSNPCELLIWKKENKASLEPSGYRICPSTASVTVTLELARYIPWPVVIDLMSPSYLGERSGGSSNHLLCWKLELICCLKKILQFESLLLTIFFLLSGLDNTEISSSKHFLTNAWIYTTEVSFSSSYNRSSLSQEMQMLPGSVNTKGHPQLSWTTCSSVSPPSLRLFFFISNVNLLIFNLKPCPVVLSPRALITGISPLLLYAPFI